jgi:protein SCO1
MGVQSVFRRSFCLLLLACLLSAVGCGQSATSTLAAHETSKTETASASIGSSAKMSTSKGPSPCCKVAASSNEPAVNANEPAAKAEVKIQTIPGGIALPDISLVNQDGESVRFHSDLVKGRIAAISFIFTTCKGICPPIGANFAALQRQLGRRFGDHVALISVSVDPATDTPDRLKAWRDRFGGGPGWTLLTGAKQDVDHLLKDLEVFTADKNDHSPFILLGDEAAGTWSRVHGLTAPEKLAEIIANLHDASPAVGIGPAGKMTAEGDDAQGAVPETRPSEQPVLSPAHKYFTDVELVNQHGERMRLYSDLLKDKIVVINSFFTTCKGSCPVMLASFAKIQEHFADRLGKDLFMISITVDPQTDTPETLAKYAEQWKARPGWLFLTGEKENVDAALFKLGQYAESKETHSNVFIIGNEATGLWKKARGLSEATTLFPLIEAVLNDRK